MSNVTFLSPDDAFHVDRATFEREAEARFSPEGGQLRDSDDGTVSDVVVNISRPGETSFAIWHGQAGDTIWTDATPDQVVAVALWVCSLLTSANNGGRVWMTDEGFTGHVELRPGMTEAELSSEWVDHGDTPPEV